MDWDIIKIVEFEEIVHRSIHGKIYTVVEMAASHAIVNPKIVNQILKIAPKDQWYTRHGAICVNEKWKMEKRKMNRMRKRERNPVNQ